MTNLPDYIELPSCAILTDSPTAKAEPAKVPTATRSRLPSFPPPTAAPAQSSSRKFSVPTTSSLSTNVSDLLLNSLLPPNLPKLPQSAAGKGGGGPGKPRELSTQREALSLPLVSNNFRRFVTKVGPLFWLQDRIEEILFWRKPKQTWAFLLIWTFISFKPRILLLLPSVTLIILLLHIHERTTPIPTLLGVSIAPPSIGTQRVGSSPAQTQGPFSATTGPDGEALPTVPPKEAESGVDYYMNLQAIQNLMGQVSDIYDYITPRLQTLSTPVSTPTTFPLTLTHLILVLLPPTLLLPLLPSPLLPYLLLPLGYAPPLLFHPNLTPFVLALPRHPTILWTRSFLEQLAMTDSLNDDIGRCELSKVEVWENERLDPSVAAKPPPGNILPQGAWSSRHLRAGERAPWVKVIGEHGLWEKDGIQPAKSGEEKKDKDKDGSDKMVLALKNGWEFVPSEEWRVDIYGLWSVTGTDEDGWSYMDDSWQAPAPLPMDLEMPSTTAPAAGVGTGAGTEKGLPGLAVRKVTRRRRWWRRVLQD